MTEHAEKILKFAALAFDPAAQPGEAESAAVMLVRYTRRQNFTFEVVKRLMGGTEVYVGNIRMPFGKFKGKTIAQIYEQSPDYLSWAVRELTGRPQLIRSIKKFLEQQ